jgi:hypothetical protein
MGETNGFVAKFNKVSGALVYSTYLGGGGSDSANGIALDQEGDAYVTGITYSSNFPVTTGAYQSKNNGLSNSASNAFLTELNPAGSGLIYSTYIGGSGISITSGGCGCDGYGVQNINGDSSNGIALGSSGIVYLAGTSPRQTFPQPRAPFSPEPEQPRKLTPSGRYAH